jgi:putative spermidine/putrescine transport system substrate-binding protein
MRAWRIGLAILGCMALAACGGTQASSAPAAASPGAQTGKPPAGGGADWDALVAAAKKEGKVTLTVGAGGGAQARQVLTPAFKEDFGIDLEVLVSPSTQMVSRLKLEQSSGSTTMDVAIGGSDTMYLTLYGEKLIDPMGPKLINPDVLNGSNWFSGKPWFMDPEGQYILRLSNGVTGQTAINTSMVNIADMTSINDLLKPQYKGKMAGFDPTINGSGAQHAVMLQIELGADFVKKLYGDQQVVRTQDNRQLADWVGRGNYPIAVAMNAGNLEQAKKDGLPIKEVAFKDAPPYLTAGSGLMALLKGAPHPAAAQLFMNWMALPKAQIAYNKAIQMVSPLNTVKSDWVPDYVIPKSDVKYIDLYDWDYTVNKYPKVFKDIRKELGAD